MRWSRLVGVVVAVAVAVCALLIGCDEATMMKKFTPPDEESIAAGYVNLLRQREYDKIEHDMDTRLVDSHLRDTLAQMAALFPDESPQSVKVVGAHVFHGQEASKAAITFEYQFPTKWLLVDVTTQNAGNLRSILGLHVTPLADSLENLNRFTLVGKSALQYFTLICAIASFLFSLYVFALCARAKNLRAKWLWMIIVLLGVGKFAVNWGTAEWTYQLIAIQVPCFSMTRPFYGPWTVAAYLPAGALAFLQHRWKMRVSGESA